ncbi:MAG: TetR/AcrR family transcriptional regulator [Acidimicrobiales bacterium]
MAATTSDRVDPRVVRSRARVLHAAAELLVEGGPRNVTVDLVSERSGVAKSTMYRHWSSRAELLLDVLRTRLPPLDTPDLTAGFEAALRSVARQAAATMADPEWARMLPSMYVLRLQEPELARLADASKQDRVDQLRAILDLGAAEGRVPAGLDPERVVALLVGPMMFAAFNNAVPDRADEADNDAAPERAGAHRDAATMADLADDVVDRFLAFYRA